jgi:hypothetical protein
VTLSYAYASNAEQACLVAFLQLLFPLLTSDALETRVYTKSAEYFQVSLGCLKLYPLSTDK